MTQDEIIKLAREAGFAEKYGYVTDLVCIDRFANLVAASEREACAIVAENKEAWYDDSRGIAKAIRARNRA
jgi:hypothetical protein